MAETVTVLPETTDTAVCVRLSGMVTAEDFARNLGDRVEQTVGTYGYYSSYILYDETFKGWSREAADLSFRHISQFSRKARRLAYVNAPDSRMLMMKMLQPITNAEIRYFELDEKEQAIAWILER